MNANSSPPRRRLEDPPWIEGRDRLAEAAFRVSRGCGRAASRTPRRPVIAVLD